MKLIKQAKKLTSNRCLNFILPLKTKTLSSFLVLLSSSQISCLLLCFIVSLHHFNLKLPGNLLFSRPQSSLIHCQSLQLLFLREFFHLQHFKLQQNTVDLKVIKDQFILPTIGCNRKIHNRTERVMIIPWKIWNCRGFCSSWKYEFSIRGFSLTRQIRINNFPSNQNNRQSFWDEFSLIEGD